MRETRVVKLSTFDFPLSTMNSATGSPARKNRPSGGYTVLDVLAAAALVFSIAAILTPRYRTAEVRAGVTRARSDLMRLGQALDVYRLDTGAYPPSVDSPALTPISAAIYGAPDHAPPLTSHRMALIPLTTPIAYLERVDFDAPFVSMAWEISEAERRSNPLSYWYNNYMDFHRTARGAVAPLPRPGYCLLAFGPRSRGIAGVSAPYADIVPGLYNVPCFNRPNARHVYDPTNGAYSAGNFFRFSSELGLEPGLRHLP